MATACYDPNAAIQVWEGMAEAGGASPPELLSTHPSHASRIEALVGFMDEAQEARENADCPEVVSGLAG